MTPRNAALLLLLTAVAGQGLVRWRGGKGVAPGEVAFRLGDTTSLPGHRLATSRPAEVSEGERVDIDQAAAGELARLPGVGPALAKRIAAERARNGPFGGAPCLDARVSGIGAVFLRRAGPHLVFSAGGCPAAGGTVPPGATLGARSGEGGCPVTIDLNRATKAELECLPGIGAARAAAILRWRSSRGGFREVGELRGVPELPEGVVERVLERVSAGPVP